MGGYSLYEKSFRETLSEPQELQVTEVEVQDVPLAEVRTVAGLSVPFSKLINQIQKYHIFSLSYYYTLHHSKHHYCLLTPYNLQYHLHYYLVHYYSIFSTHQPMLHYQACTLMMAHYKEYLLIHYLQMLYHCPIPLLLLWLCHQLPSKFLVKCIIRLSTSHSLLQCLLL